ncbi:MULTISPECIES: hypothetical protein [unclassified Microbulbifer]|nr:hypothetical protein [Microbulbifer sp. YPW16]UHQ55265.1 hypothetical protein LVE68_17420 [Microbulbifer sp. YPW16]
MAAMDTTLLEFIVLFFGGVCLLLSNELHRFFITVKKCCKAFLDMQGRPAWNPWQTEFSAAIDYKTGTPQSMRAGENFP